MTFQLTLTTLAGTGLAAVQPAPTGPRRLALEKHDCPEVLAAAFSPDGRVIAVSGFKPAEAVDESEDVLTLWDVSTGKNLHTFRGHDAGASGFCFSPDGRLLAQPVTEAGEVILRAVANGKELRRLKHKEVYSLDFSPDGKHLATTSGGERRKSSRVHVWEVATGKRVFTPTRAKDEVFRLAMFVPDGRLLIDSDAGKVRWWNPATGHEDPPLTLAGGDRTATPSRDGKCFLGTPAGRPTLYDGATGQVVRTFGRGGDDYGSAMLSENATAVIATDKTGRVVVWDAATGTQRGTIAVAGAGAAGPFVSSTPDDRYLIANSTVPTADKGDTIPTVAVYTPDCRLVRRAEGAWDVTFDDVGRMLVVIARAPATPDQPARYDVTIHDAATWLAGPTKKD